MLLDFSLNTNLKPGQGKLLISEPFMMDPNFKRTVILLCEHNDKGSFGLVLNKKLDIQLHEIIEEFPKLNSAVGIGGPVEKDRLFYVHNCPDVEDCMEVQEGIYVGGSFESLKTLISIGKIKDEDVRFFLGYSGWTENQLDGEIIENAWIVANTDPTSILNKNDEALWSESLRSLGKNFAIMASFPEDPSLN